MHWPTLLIQLWNKGVDILAGIVVNGFSAGIVALIAMMFWNFKCRRDLKLEADKQRQQHQIAAELKSKDQAREQALLQQRLFLELEGLAVRFQRARDEGNGFHLQTAWDEWLAWMDKNNLRAIPGNQAILNGWNSHSNKFESMSQQNVIMQAEKLLVIIATTRLSN